MGLGGGKGVYPLVAHWHCEPAIFGLVAGTQSITQPIFFTPLLAFSAGPCPARGVSGVGSSVGGRSREHPPVPLGWSGEGRGGGGGRAGTNPRLHGAGRASACEAQMSAGPPL